jgi:hypothetical protein
MKKLIILCIIIITPAVSHAEVTAPFGLDWGQSKRSITQKGVRLNDCKTIAKGVESCTASNLPKPISFAESYKLIFDLGRGLQKTQLFGEDINNDAYGTDGKRLYSKLKDTFIAKYPSSEYEHLSYEWVGRELYKDSNEFYECLNYDMSCGNWSTYIIGKGNVVVELKGISRGKGWLLMTHESPEWEDILDNANSKEDESDLDAL